MSLENSIMFHEHGDAPSSPFVSELATNRHDPSSRTRNNSMECGYSDSWTASEMRAASVKAAKYNIFDVEDKENVQANSKDNYNTTVDSTVSSRENRSPLKAMRDPTYSRHGAANFESMPPPPSVQRARKYLGTSVKESFEGRRNLSPAQKPERSARDLFSTVTSTMRLNIDTQDRPMSRARDVTNIDDTCFSTFSEAPDIATLTKLTQSPAKSPDLHQTPKMDPSRTPRASRKRCSPSRSPSPTPRRKKTPASQTNEDGTTFLIDFTQQMEGVTGPGSRSPIKSSTESNLLSYINRQRSPNKSGKTIHSTPHKQNNILNLLDFELPPAPTPRSIPTITVRELEALKSSYLSQISSLKATLSGREAEVDSLKRAVSDAERRVGEAQEALGAERNRREDVEQEKEGWERRGREVEAVLMNVKEEVIKSEAEKEEVMRKTEELERRLEEAEDRMMKAETRCAEAMAAQISGTALQDEAGSVSIDEQVQRLVAIQIDSKIEAVGRELHAVYKDKHERKVATLKKSYEARGEKKCAELREKLGQLEKQHEDLLAKQDATFSGPLDSKHGDVVELKAQVEEYKATSARLDGELRASRDQQDQLMRELQQERIEKGELVAAVDEMLALQIEQTSSSSSGPTNAAMSVVEDFRKSIRDTRPSGLRTPGAGLGESRIGRFGLASGVPKSSGLPGKSKMLANIERMGSRVGSTSSVEL